MHFDREAFERHVGQYAGKFEERRRRYFTRFCLHLLISLAALSGMLLGRAHIPDFRASYALATAAGMAFTLWPVFAYARRTRSIGGVVALKISMKEFVFSHIFRFFGALEFKGQGGVSPQALRQAPLFPEFSGLRVEDYIAGDFRGVRLEMSEAELLDRGASLFKGIVILLDISDSGGVLRAPFAGNTVLVQDEAKHLERIKERFPEYRHVPLPSAEHERRFEALSTAPEEAGALLTGPFLDALLGVSRSLRAASAGGAPGEFAQVLSRDLHCSLYRDKALITVPYGHNLFESGDLFKPALVEEDKNLVFNLMEALAEIARHVTARKT